MLLKAGYTVAGNNDLKFLLAPTNKLVSLVSNSPFEYAAESGYFHKELGIIIEKSCSGFNFWILSFMMLAFAVVNYCDSSSKKLLLLPLLLIIAYCITIAANTSRIILSVLAQNTANNFLPARPHFVLHDTVGIMVYLFYLITCYLLLAYIIKKQPRNNAQLT